MEQPSNKKIVNLNTSVLTTIYGYVHYLFETLWKDSDNPDTSKILADACDAHIQSKNFNLKRARKAEDDQRKVLQNARKESEHAKGNEDEKKRALKEIVTNMENRFKLLQNAIDLALDETNMPEKIEAHRQTCVMAHEFDAGEYSDKITCIQLEIANANRIYRSLKQREDGAKARLEEMENERKIIEKHIDEIHHIKTQLDERLAPKILPRLPVSEVSVAAIPVENNSVNETVPIPRFERPILNNMTDNNNIPYTYASAPEQISPDSEKWELNII